MDEVVENLPDAQPPLPGGSLLWGLSITAEAEVIPASHVTEE